MTAFMDPSEIIKAAPQLIKAAAPVAAAIPFTGIVKRMLGPAADELAEMWRDQIRLYRYSRQIKCVEKAEKMAEEAGFTPSAVPPKILFPLLEGASLEDNEDMHTMWAALLANASSKMRDIVRPSFISLLKNMAPDEAVLLQELFEQRTRINLLEPDFERQVKFVTSLTTTSMSPEEQTLREKMLLIRHEFGSKFVPIEGEGPDDTRLRFMPLGVGRGRFS